MIGPNCYAVHGSTNVTGAGVVTNQSGQLIAENGFKPDATPVARTLTMRYNRQGQLIELDGARQNVQDMTRIAYYECGPNETPRGHCGQIKSLTNALGHTLHYRTYDAAGRVTKFQEPNGVVTTYRYNQAGRLTKIIDKQSNLIAEYQYNAFNQRTKKTINGRSTYYHYGLQGQLIAETDSSVVSYLWLDSQPIAQLKATAITYLISDHLNTPRMGLDQSQNIVWQWHSDGFGKNEPVGTETVNLRFPGQYADQETGLFYNWHRYYNPNTGRYITSDQIGLNAGINTYGYVGGNPVNSYDLMGLQWDTDDFVEHYYFGFGAAVSLSRIGLSDEFENAPSVEFIVNEFVIDTINAITSSGASSYIGYSQGDYDVTNDGPVSLSIYSGIISLFGVPVQAYNAALFSVGNGVLDMYADCSNGSCDFRFSMNDWFGDVLDINDSEEGNQEAGGTPYDIYHSWNMTIQIGACQR